MQDIYVIVLVQNHVIRLAGRYKIFPTKMEFAISNSFKVCDCMAGVGSYIFLYGSSTPLLKWFMK